MDEFVSQTTVFSSRGRFSDCVAYILPKLHDTLQRTRLASMAGTDIPLCDLAQAAVLIAAAELPSPSWPDLLPRIGVLITAADDAEMLGGTVLFSQLCHVFTNAVAKPQHVEFLPEAVAVLKNAVSRLQHNPTQLTPVHADYLQLCLLLHNFNDAKELVYIQYDSMNPTGEDFESKYALLFYYYGGLVYSGLRDWSSARLYFETAIAVPGAINSFIAVEAYKKWTIVSVLQKGHVPPHSHINIYASLKAYCEVYSNLAIQYVSGSPVQLEEVLNQHRAELITDRNLSLARLLLRSQLRRNVKQLARVFASLTLADVARRARISDLDTARACLEELTAAGDICATIEGDVVTLSEAPPQQPDDTISRQLTASINLIVLERELAQAKESGLLTNVVRG